MDAESDGRGHTCPAVVGCDLREVRSLSNTITWECPTRIAYRIIHMVKHVSIALVMAVAGCSGDLIVPDGGSDSGVDAPGNALDATIDSNDDAQWFSQFDVYQFEGWNPPVVGEYPDFEGGGCSNDLACSPLARCDPDTGWCCSGERTSQGCVCGYGWGCLPPRICCDLADAQVPACVDSLDACPGGHTPWNP